MKNILQNMRYDLPASIVVFFVALPLCLGIALACGAPLFSGIIAGIIGGVIVGALSGSQVGVSGPAAGLCVIVFDYALKLGSWEAFLVVTILAGIFQVAMGFMRLGSIAYYFPKSVINGMLFGIGVIIMIKQIPHAIGYDNRIDLDFEEFIGSASIAQFREIFSHVNLSGIAITIISMAILISWEMFLVNKYKIFKILSAPLVVIMTGILMTNILNSPDLQLVNIPVSESISHFLTNFTLPDFSQFKNLQVYFMALVVAVVASLETLLCVEATDKLDLLKRRTPTNRELKAQGIGNILSGLIGGLPITQVIVRSSTNISFGARTKISAISHGFLLLILVMTIPDFLNMVPLASLACILLFVGYKLAHPSVLKKFYDFGFEQFIPFFITVLGMIVFDLLYGVCLGIAAALIISFYKKLTVKTLTKQSRDALTPKMALDLLKKGNVRFLTNLKNDHNLLKQVNDTSEDQHPFAFVLSCIDSRTSAELIFDQGLGDIFSCRIAGNILNEDILGSMEFACKIGGVKLIMVLGHSGCGAIKGACDDVKMGNLTHLLKKIEPAILNEKTVKKNRSSHNSEFVEKVASLNVREVMKQIPQRSEIVKNAIKSGDIIIAGGFYDVSTGEVEFIN